MRIFEVDRGGWLEYHVSGNMHHAGMEPGEDEARFFELVKLSDAARIRIYGSCGDSMNEFAGLLSGDNIVLDCFKDSVETRREITGVCAVLVRVKDGCEISTYNFDGGGLGWVVDASGTRMGFLSRVAEPGQGADIDSYRKTFSDSVKYITEMGFTPADIKRTWCLFSDVLAEYGVFNQQRREIFIEAGIPPDALPASTGVQCVPAGLQPLMMDTLAFSGDALETKSLSNPGQCDPSEYGSLFARAACVQGAGPNQLIVSGMASIAENGETLHVGDLEAQVRTTVEKAAVLLNSFGLEWKHVCSGIVYIHPDYYENTLQVIAGMAPGELDFACAVGEICRDDLIFEIEFMAFG